MSWPLRTLFLICIIAIGATLIALPPSVPLRGELFGRTIDLTIGSPVIGGRTFALKQGLDLQGGMQVTLQADMSAIPAEDQTRALESVREVILRRVDLYGVNEPLVQTARVGDEYRLLVELPGVENAQQALQLVGTTAQLDFRLIETAPTNEATESAATLIPTGLNGSHLRRAIPSLDPQTGEPVIQIEFTPEGATLFGTITTVHKGKLLGVFLDEAFVMAPRISEAIVDGKAVINGGFTEAEIRQLGIQLNAGALPVPIHVLQQRTIGPSLGQEAVRQSVRAGLIGVGLVIGLMVLFYRFAGVLAGLALVIYAVVTLALYKVLGITLTLPGIAGLLLSIGMAVDANILIFERMREELKKGRAFDDAREVGFGRAWDSIKDANTATIVTALILINPLDVPFLNTSGLVRGFGVTLLLGVLVSLFTGIVVTRTLVRLFLKGPRL